MTNDDDVAKLAELIAEFPIAMVVSLDDLGRPLSQPLAMQAQHHRFDGELWFLTSAGSTTVERIAANPDVNVALSSNSSWVSATGTGRLSADRAQVAQLWDKSSEAWFPDGPDDDSLRVLIVSVSSIEYWDTPGGTVSTLVSFVKSKVSGEPMEIDSDKVDLTP